jgi:hypothetical protein
MEAHFTVAASLHEFDSETEESAGFVIDHFDVFLFGWTCETITPKKIHSLTSMEINQLVYISLRGRTMLPE